MNAWWSARSSREQALIALAAALFAGVIALQGVVRPIADWRAAARDRAAAAENNYRLVARAAAMTAPPDAADAGAQIPARNAVIDAARRLQVTLTFVNARPDGSVEVQAGPADPERVFALFATLQRRHGVSVVNADMARSPENPDQVRLQATLSRGGGSP